MPNLLQNQHQTWTQCCWFWRNELIGDQQCWRQQIDYDCFKRKHPNLLSLTFLQRKGSKKRSKEKRWNKFRHLTVLIVSHQKNEAQIYNLKLKNEGVIHMNLDECQQISSDGSQSGPLNRSVISSELFNDVSLLIGASVLEQINFSTGYVPLPVKTAIIRPFNKKFTWLGRFGKL